MKLREGNVEEVEELEEADVNLGEGDEEKRKKRERGSGRRKI